MSTLRGFSLLSKNHSLALLAAVLPVAVPAACLLYLRHSISPHVRTSTGRRSPGNTKPESSQPALPISIPEDVSPGESEYILSHERITSHSTPLSTLRHTQPSSLVTAYLRATMEAFSWTPQAFLIRALINDPDVKGTFDKARIVRMDFDVGELVNGVYRVMYRGVNPNGGGGERVELMIDAPASYDGPEVKGIIVASVERRDKQETEKDDDAESIIFVNETWMWRKSDEKPTMLEGIVGRWMHSLLGGWLLIRGMKAVRGP